jgi:RimJ/RimL family protein N-acetyltransferase
VDDVTGAQASDEPGELATERLVLRPMTAEHVAAVTSGRRLSRWAPDYPSDGDRRIAGLLERQGVPAGPDAVFGHRLVAELQTGQVVGGIGLKGPPTDGQVELGYGIAESRRGRGYATEAVRAMADLAADLPGVRQVVAGVDPTNAASVRVLEKAGFVVEFRNGDELRYVLQPPSLPTGAAG